MRRVEVYRYSQEFRTLSSTKTLPFFFPRGFSTPTGVIILSFGNPNSLSVYTLRFFLCGPCADFVFCCFGGGAFTLDLEMRFLTLEPLPVGLPLPLLLDLLLDFADPCFDGGPLLGAIALFSHGLLH